jgi:hypothetical protein
MKPSKRLIGAAALCLTFAIGFGVSRVFAVPPDGPTTKTTHGKPSEVALSQELVRMCAFCDAFSTHHRDPSGPPSDECIRDYPEAGQGHEHSQNITGCSYPPCTVVNQGTGSSTLEDKGNPETKLACAACRALCPFSAGIPHHVKTP